MLLRTLLLLLLPGTAHWLNAQQNTPIPVTVRLATHGSVVFKPAPSAGEAKQYGLQSSDATLVRQLENRNGLLIYTPEAAKGKEHALFTVGLLQNHRLDMQLAKGEVRFEDIDNAVTGSITSGNVIVTGGKANVSLQLQSGDITVRQSQWRGSAMTQKGNILLEDSPLLKGHASNGTVIHRYTEAGLKDKKELSQSFETGRIELTGQVAMADLQLHRGEILLVGKAQQASVSVRDTGNITVTEMGKTLRARTRKGRINITAASSFESLHIDCEDGELNLTIPKSFQGKVKIVSEAVGAEKPLFTLVNFLQSQTPSFKPVTVTPEEKGKPVAGYFKYLFEGQIGEGSATLFIYVRNSHLSIHPL